MWGVLCECIISDRLCCVITTSDPSHGSAATVGDAPDDAILLPILGDAVGVVDVCRPVASVLIEVCPGGGLHCPSGGRHVVSVLLNQL